MISKSVLDKLEFSKVLQYIAKYAATENGKQLILETQPYSSEAEAVDEGQRVNEAKETLIKNIPPPIEYIPDVYEILSQSAIEGAVLDGRKIVDVLRLAVTSRTLYQFLKNQAEASPLLFNIVREIYVDKLLEHHIQKVITENGEVKENASQKLLTIRREIAAKKDDLVRSVNRILKSLEKEMVREEYVTLRDGRIVIPVKVEHKRHVRGFIHSESSTGQTVYIEPEETLELNNEIISLGFAEKREIEKILRELTKKIGESSTQLKDALTRITIIDSIFAKAKYSIEIIGSFPNIKRKNIFHLIDARHPLLIKRLGRNSSVPLNVKIEKGNVLLITGPNAGGKTVVLKTLGLLSLMVNSGIHIPAQPDSNFWFFNQVLVDIGDQQSIEDDLSTFSSHLTNILHILRNASENTLVLLDEIGTGTDPVEGSALAAATLIKLRDKKSLVLASTHHGNLKLIANELEGFENAAMEFDHENLKPTYKFKQGIPGSSYAFEIAKRIGFENNFLSLAEDYLDADKHKVEGFLVEIEAKSKSLEDKLKKVELENSRLSGLSNLYKSNVNKLEKEKKEILKKAKEDAENYLKDVNKKVEKVIKDLKETNADKEKIKESKKIISEIKTVNVNLYKEEPELVNKEFEIGDYAKIKNTETKGQIIEITKDKKSVILNVGGLKMKVQANNIEPAKKDKNTITPTQLYDVSAIQPEMRLDIRGAKPEEAEYDIVKFLDNAYSAGLNRVEILHGKGTGALKSTVKQILKQHEKIKNYYFAPVEFGGEGITIVELM